MREDWIHASAQLLNEAEEWARQADWPTKRYSREVTEDFIGKYNQERLVYSAEGQQLALVPVGRFAPGTDGLFDLAVMPAYDSFMVVRDHDQWFIHPEPGKKKRHRWSRDTFRDSSLNLARLP